MCFIILPNSNFASMTARPAYSVGPSACYTFPGFSPVDLFPIRSPLVVADYLGPQLQGRSFCEIGTRNGDVMSCLSHYAKEVIAVEMDEGYCAKLRSRGFSVVCENSEQIPLAEYPMADIYYWWPSDAGGQNELWLLLIARALRLAGRTASVYIGADYHWKPDMKYMYELAKRYNGTIQRLFFDEGGQMRGPAVPRQPGSSRAAEFEASLARPFYDRPGHWGIFFVSRFDIGPAFWALMDRSPFSHPVLWRHDNGKVASSNPRGRGRARGVRGRGGRGRGRGRPLDNAGPKDI